MNKFESLMCICVPTDIEYGVFDGKFSLDGATGDSQLNAPTPTRVT